MAPRIIDFSDGFTSNAAPTIGVLSLETGTRASPIAITAVGGITPAGYGLEAISIQGSGGAVTVTANPQIAAGTAVGQLLLLIGRSDTNTVTLANGTGLSLNGNIALGDDSNILLRWDGTNWEEVARR